MKKLLAVCLVSALSLLGSNAWAGTAREVLSRAKLEQLWVMKRFAAYRAPAPMDTRVWSR